MEKLTQLDAPPSELLIGMEATSCYGENLSQELEQRGYRLCLLHPGQTHQFHRQQGLRAKTDRLDAMTIARVHLSGEARAGYIRSRAGRHKLGNWCAYTPSCPMKQRALKMRSKLW